MTRTPNPHRVWGSRHFKQPSLGHELDSIGPMVEPPGRQPSTARPATDSCICSRCWSTRSSVIAVAPADCGHTPGGAWLTRRTSITPHAPARGGNTSVTTMSRSRDSLNSAHRRCSMRRRLGAAPSGTRRVWCPTGPAPLQWARRRIREGGWSMIRRSPRFAAWPGTTPDISTGSAAVVDVH